MNPDQFRAQLQPLELKDRHGIPIQLSDRRSQRILAHYANRPSLGSYALQLIIADLKGLNRK